MSALRHGSETECVLVWKSRREKYSYIHPDALEVMEEVSGNVL